MRKTEKKIAETNDDKVLVIRESYDTHEMSDEEFNVTFEVNEAIKKYVKVLNIKEDTIFEWRGSVLGLKITPSKRYRR